MIGHKVVTCFQNQVEKNISPVFLADFVEFEAVGKVSEAAGVKLVIGDDDRMREQFYSGRTSDFNIVHAAVCRKRQLFSFTVFYMVFYGARLGADR